MSEWLILTLSGSGFWGPMVSRTMPSLVLDGINCPKKDPGHNLEVFLDSQLFLNEQVAVLAGRNFAQLCVVCQLHLFLDQQTLLTVSHLCPTHLQIGLLQWILYGAALEEYQKFQLVQKIVVWAVMCALRIVHVISLLCELHWLSDCFQSNSTADAVFDL